MPNIESLRIVGPAGRVLTPDQKRFNTLLQQIERARSALREWHDNVAQYAQAHAQLIVPLHADLRAARRQWVFALEALLGRRGWTRAERETIVELICGAAGELLEADDGDEQLQVLFAEHAQTDFDSERLEALHAMKDLAETITGLDLGEDEGITSEDDLMHRLHQGMQQQMAADEARRDARASRRRQSAAQRRREAQAQQVTQSVREVYRKLASALHPDRAADAQQREAKTALMQQVNQAYDSNDLLALLELQLRIEQIDADHMASAGAQRVKHFNKVLAEQLRDLKDEIAQVELTFRIDFGLGPGPALNPSKLGSLLEQQARELRGEAAQLRHELRLFDDTSRTKRWLKRQREALRAAATDFF